MVAICAPTRSINSAGFIPRSEANALFGYSENNVFRGFGDEHSGLKEIEEELFTRLLNRFSISTENNEKEHIARALSPRFVPAARNLNILRLSERIAEDPAGVLGEAGLRFGLWNGPYQQATESTWY